VPEPTTLAFLGTGAFGLFACRFLRRRKAAYCSREPEPLMTFKLRLTTAA
jgi:hypothetical protein